jgi:hypothetical protein
MPRTITVQQAGIFHFLFATAVKSGQKLGCFRVATDIVFHQAAFFVTKLIMEGEILFLAN